MRKEKKGKKKGRDKVFLIGADLFKVTNERMNSKPNTKQKIMLFLGFNFCIRLHQHNHLMPINKRFIFDSWILLYDERSTETINLS